MTALDLTRLKAAAQEASGAPWPLRERAWQLRMKPAVVLELIARLERAEALAETLDEQVQCLTIQRNEFKAHAQDAEDIINSKLPPITQCPGCYMVHDPRHGAASPMPNDPLDDVLPLAGERREPYTADTMVSDLNAIFMATALPDHLPDSEGGHHD